MRQPHYQFCILHSALCFALVSASANAALPSGYRQYTSITSTGTQYIQTGMKPTSSTTVEMDFNTGPYKADTTFFGQSWGGSQFLFIKQSNQYRFYGSGGQVSALNNNTDAHLSITSDNKFILDYGATAVTTTVSRATSANAFNIFADGSGGHKGSWTLYSMQISTDGVLVRDFVPAKRQADGVGGLYDLVEDKFYTNAGTGSFTMGEEAAEPDWLDITSLPDGIGSPSPAYGITSGLSAGDTFIVSCGATTATDAAGTTQYSCTGWKLYDESNTVISNGVGTSFTYTHPTPAAYRRLEWQWEATAYRGAIAADSDGAVSPSGTNWYAAGTPVTVTATPNAGKGLLRWTGTLPAGIDATSPSVTFTPTAPFDMTAVFTPVIYVKADATGADNGTSWTDAYTDVSNALAHASADDLVFIAKGRYVIKSLITVANAVSIYGGFAGQSMDETQATRDTAANQTVFTSTAGNSYYWVHYYSDGTYWTTTSAQTSKLLLGQDGVNLPPAFTGDYDGYYAQWTGNPAKYNAMRLNAAVRLDGLTFAGFRDAGGAYNSTIISLVTVNNANAVINDCTFIGNSTQNGVVGLRAAAKVTNCRMLYNHGEGRGSTFVSRAAYPTVSDCTIVSSSRMGGDAIHNVFNGWAGSFRVERCVILRCYSQLANNAQTSSYNGSGNIFASEQSGSLSSFTDCVVSNNLTTSNASLGSPLFNAGNNNLKFERCHFANNKSIVKPVAGRCYALFCQSVATKAQSFEACSFEGNLITAPQVAAASGSYALSLMGNYSGTGGFRLLNCSFLDNRAETVAKDGVTPVLGRGVAAAIVAEGATPYACMANCTFAGPDNGLYDFIQFGSFGTFTNQIVNCVFSAEGEAQPPFIYADRPDLVSLYDCTLQNKIVTTDGPNYVENHEYDKIPLATNALSAGSARFVLVPAAKTPGIRTTCDVATNAWSTTGVSLWNFRLNGDSVWRSLLYGTAVSGDFSAKLVTDAFGAARPAGGFTRGASQRLTDTAENGATLVLRRDPFSGGSFSDEAVQAVATGSATTPVTATVADPSVTRFDGWYDETNGLYSSSATLSIASLTAPLTILTAKIVSARVTLTFSLDGRGTFAATGTDTATITTNAFVAFPEIPAFTMDEGWHFLGFETPATVPAENASYVADTVESTIRVRYVAPEASGDGSGDSWANAAADLAAAYADAGRYRGEVWLKSGTYPLAARIVMKSNVTLRGGFAGNETSADEADPDANPTILTGDKNGNDYWQPNGSGGSLATTPIWSGGAFQTPNPDGADSYWWPSGGNSEDTAGAFFCESGTATNAAFDGITFTCFKGTTVSASSADTDGLAFRRCKFLACGTGRSSRTVTLSSTSASFEDCLFDGCWVGIYVSSTPVRLVTFDNCVLSNTVYNGNNGGAVYAGGNGFVHIRDCFFSRSYNNSFGNAGGTALCLDNNANASISNSVVDTVFAENRPWGKAIGTVVINSTARTWFERCRFIGNSMRNLNIPSGTDTAGWSHFGACVGIDSYEGRGSCVMRDCFFSGNAANDVSGNSREFASVAYVQQGSILMVNCTIEDSAATASGDTKCGVFALRGGNLGLVNCLVNGTSLTGDNASEVRVLGGTLTIVNTVLRNESADYVPFSTVSTFVPRIANSVISGYDTADLPATGSNGYLIDVVSGTAPVKPARTGSNGARAAGVRSTPYGRHGRPVWMPGATAYFYDGNAARWRSLPAGGTATSVTGLTTDSPLIPDAFGVPRVSGHVAPGPLNAAPAGTGIILR